MKTLWENTSLLYLRYGFLRWAAADRAWERSNVRHTVTHNYPACVSSGSLTSMSLDDAGSWRLREPREKKKTSRRATKLCRERPHSGVHFSLESVWGELRKETPLWKVSTESLSRWVSHYLTHLPTNQHVRNGRCVISMLIKEHAACAAC